MISQNKIIKIVKGIYKRFAFAAIILFVCFLPAIGQNNPMSAVTKDGIYILTNGNLSIVIDGNNGSRVISLKLDGEEILGSKHEHPKYYGSTLWLSPEGKWRGQAVLDASAYTNEFFNGEELRLRSNIDTVSGFEFLKVFLTNMSDTSIIIKYTITNISKEPQEVSPWEVTRVPTGGLAFFPKRSEEDVPVANNRLPVLNICDSAGFIWYPYDLSLSSSQKVFMDGSSEGWVAYIRNKVVFIKKFPVVKHGLTAPGEKNIELYVNKENTYIELENQGAYQKLLPGDYLLYEVKWYARRLPAGLKVDKGNRALVNYIRDVVR
jgi:hypothetical protein